MVDANPFPESSEKAYLRRFHLTTLAEHKRKIGRDLAYFGLPSAEMLDVRVWMPVLRHVTAIERDRDVAERMFLTAHRLGIRNKMLVVERDLSIVLHLLAMGDHDYSLSLSELAPSEQRDIGVIRGLAHDVVNLDFCGGFLYPTHHGTSTNRSTLQDLISYQARQVDAFYLFLTFALRDMGSHSYVQYIGETLNLLEEAFGRKLGEMRAYYLGDDRDSESIAMKQLRFCVPVQILQLAFQHFEVSSVGAWRYKTLYHTALKLMRRHASGVLGLTWPPRDEFIELTRAPMWRLTVVDTEVQSTEIEAPSL